MKIAALSLLLLASCAGQSQMEKWRDLILPGPEETRYQAIDWRPTFWDAVVEAHQKKVPVLLWAMNGHPLACT
jgi:hypothetical protein